MSKTYFKIFLFVSVAMLVLPFFALADLQLETVYPASPSTQQLITGRSKLPDIIRYVIDWTIIAAAMASVFTLIYAGIQYLTSVGRPNAMAAAKSRVGQCLLGLLIIAGSYLLLQTINPQLTIMTIKKAQVGAGIVLFTQAGLYGNGEVDECYNAAAPTDQGCASDEINSPPILCPNHDAVYGFNTQNSETLENLIKAGEARFLSYDIEDLTAEFGDLVYESSAKEAGIATFLDFPVYGLGFWGTENTEGGAFVHSAKIFAYPKTQFSVEPDTIPTANRAIEYRIDGKADKDGQIPGVDGRPSCPANTADSGAKEFEMRLITIHDDFKPNFKSSATHYNEETTIYNYDPLKPPPNVISEIAHPPLSIKIEGRGPGVTLYAGIGGARTFSASEEDFSYSNIKFDNVADEIEIRNVDNNGVKIHDYLAILHNDYNFTGDLRIFFERKANQGDISVSNSIPNIYLDNNGFSDPDMQAYETSDKFIPVGISKPEDSFYCGDPANPSGSKKPPDECAAGEPLRPDTSAYYYNTYPPLAGLSPVPTMGLSAIPTKQQQDTGGYSAHAPLNAQDRLGRLKTGDKASSIEIFELENQKVYRETDPTVPGVVETFKENVVCQEVKLCTSKGFLNDCLVYAPNHQDYLYDKFNSPSRYNSVVLPMPLYAPVNIPKKIKNGLVKIRNDDGTIEMKRNDIEFADKIKSLEIKGDCVVALFENSVKDIQDCAACDFTKENAPGTEEECKKCWDNGPGTNSEIFTESVADLTTHSVSKCGGREKFGFGERKNCASAIAIFPLKKAQ